MSAAFVILTSKPGQFRTELTEGLEPLEAWDYLCFGRKRAGFVIARLARPTRIRIVDETPPPVVNHVPSKFLEKFESVEGARRELQELARSGGAGFILQRVDAGA
ncbi:MAG TPA: ferredoxin [Usitatibacter sp.]|nr:ferredoxin [Usitatibacter sp.]